MKKIQVLGLQTIPKIEQADREIAGLQQNDIVVLTSKIVSKAQGRIRKMADVIPGKKGRCIYHAKPVRTPDGCR